MRFYTPPGKRGYVSVTDLARFSFCPRLFLLSKLIPTRRTEQLIRGRELHNRAFREHAKGAVEVRFEEAVNLSKERKLEGREVWISDGVVYGVMDRIILERGRAVVIEYKSGKVRTLINENQVRIYGALVAKTVPRVEIELRDFQEEVHFKDSIGPADIVWLEENVRLFVQFVALGSFPSTEGPRCRRCPLKEECVRLKRIGSIGLVG